MYVIMPYMRTYTYIIICNIYVVVWHICLYMWSQYILQCHIWASICASILIVHDTYMHV